MRVRVLGNGELDARFKRGRLDYLYSELPSTFQPAPKCYDCDRGVSNVLTPQRWPINTVAITCYACGRVREYVDGVLIMRPLEAMREMQKRTHVMRRHVAIEKDLPSDFETARQMIIMGIETGLSVEDISKELAISVWDVSHIAESAGVL